MSTPRLVLSFLRSPLQFRPLERAAFARDLEDDDLAALLRRTPLNFRDNLARIWCAGRIAAEIDGRVMFLEGVRSSWIASPPGRSGGARVVTGSYTGTLLLRLLQRRRLVPDHVTCERIETSRCTIDEIVGLGARMAEIGSSAAVGVAGTSCPSATRASRYVRLLGVDARVVEARAELRDRLAGDGAERERAVLAALEPSRAERLYNAGYELLNWTVHALSETERRLRGPSRPLEVRLAHHLRRGCHGG